MKKLLVSTLITIASPSVVFAEDSPETSVFVAGGVAAAPSYEGSNSYRPIPLVIVRVNRQHRYVAIEGLTARANVINSPAYEFGPLVNVALDRSGNVGSVAVERLGTIKVAAEVGAFAGYNLNVSPISRIRLGIEATQDVASIHDGLQAQANISYSIAPSKRIGLRATASANFADDSYAQTYFGVTSTGSTASGLPVYTPDGGLKDIGLSLAGYYGISRRWSVTAIGSYRRLLGDFADSPIVAKEGSANQFFGGIGLGYRF
jgi:MipA family protein